VTGLYNTFGFLAPVIGWVLRGIHHVLSMVFDPASGWAWGLSIVLLTISVRIMIIPIFVKQVKSQRRMQEIAPKVKELQAKHKGDRETLNTELMKLYKDHGTNPVSGCLPILLQFPIFIALFRVMNEFKPKNGEFFPKYNLTATLIEQGAHAKIAGAPIAASYQTGTPLLHLLGGYATTVKIVSVVMIVLMGASQFWTQRQIMAKAGAPADPQQAQIQKTMLYILPVFFAVAGVNFPVGVLLYWLTTNFWSMGQQRWIISRMPPIQAGGAKPTSAKTPPAKTKNAKNQPAPDPDPAPVAAAPAAPAKTAAQRATSGRAAGSRKNKNRKGGRRR
jgi:YidC/Oxa1 family membrane protein insertase